jgi:hypothetical protein
MTMRGGLYNYEEPDKNVMRSKFKFSNDDFSAAMSYYLYNHKKKLFH